MAIFRNGTSGIFSGGEVETLVELPANPHDGDVYLIKDIDQFRVWDGHGGSWKEPISGSPGHHAPTHEKLGGDEIIIQDLSSGLAAAGEMFEADGVGGVRLVTPGTATIHGICPAGTLVGDSIYVSGDKVAGEWTVDRADITDVEKLPYGVVIAKATPTKCTIQTLGEIGIYVGLTPNLPLYYGAGVGARLTHTIPTPGGTWFLKQAGVAVGSSSILLQDYMVICIVS